MYPKNLLVVITAILLLVNSYVISEFDLELSRWARLISTSIFFLILLWHNDYSKRILGAFFLLIISDFLLFSYEDPAFNSLTFIGRISGYILLISAVAPDLKKIKTNLFQKSIFIGVLGLNLFMLVTLLDMVPNRFQYPQLDILFLGYGLTMIVMVITALTYSNRYASRASFYFTAAALFLVFSDITSFIGYYLGFYEFYFPDRIFYILGISGLVKFATLITSYKPVSALERL